MAVRRYTMRPLFTGGACLLLSACTVLGPDYQSPSVDEMAGWHSASEGQAALSAADYRQWWDNLHDPVLSALVLEALRKNPDVRIAGSRILEAQAQLIAGAKGLSGRNIDYLSDLVGHLQADGLRDRSMEALLRRVEVLEP